MHKTRLLPVSLFLLPTQIVNYVWAKYLRDRAVNLPRHVAWIIASFSSVKIEYAGWIITILLCLYFDWTEWYRGTRPSSKVILWWVTNSKRSTRKRIWVDSHIRVTHLSKINQIMVTKFRLPQYEKWIEPDMGKKAKIFSRVKNSNSPGTRPLLPPWVRPCGVARPPRWECMGRPGVRSH